MNPDLWIHLFTWVSVRVQGEGMLTHEEESDIDRLISSSFVFFDVFSLRSVDFANSYLDQHAANPGKSRSQPTVN
jgi:hypothetical protein